MSSKKEIFVFKGKLFWAHVRNPNKMSGKYQVDVSLDSETEAKLKKLGISIKDKSDERGKFVTLKSDFAPKVVDKDKSPIAEDVLLGNGTEANIAAHLYQWEFRNKKGVNLGLDAIQVVELVVYKSKGSTDAFDNLNGDKDNEAF